MRGRERIKNRETNDTKLFEVVFEIYSKIDNSLILNQFICLFGNEFGQTIPNNQFIQLRQYIIG
jgi:hypothetical protein